MKPEYKERTTLSGIVVLELVDPDGRKESVVRENQITNKFRSQFASWASGTAITVPNFCAIGNDSTTAAATDTALGKEFARNTVTTRSIWSTYSARYVTTFTTTQGVGILKEAGIFDATHSILAVSACDVTTNWTSNNTLSQDTSSARQEGSACLKAVGSGSVSFRNQVLGLGANSMTTASYLQLAYYIDNKSLISSNITVELSSSTSDDTNEYQWAVTTASLANGWNWLNLLISDATVTGTPDLDALVRFRMTSTKTGSVTEKIDNIRLFTKTGNMFSRVSNLNLTKTILQVLNIYWYYQMEAS